MLKKKAAEKERGPTGVSGMESRTSGGVYFEFEENEPCSNGTAVYSDNSRVGSETTALYSRVADDDIVDTEPFTS